MSYAKYDDDTQPVAQDGPKWTTLLEEIRASQLRTEAMVKDFIEAQSNNPMFKTLSRMFGGS